MATDGLGAKLPISACGVEGHLFCMRGCSCLCKVLRVPLPSVNHIGVGLKEELNGPKIPTCEQV